MPAPRGHPHSTAGIDDPLAAHLATRAAKTGFFLATQTHRSSIRPLSNGSMPPQLRSTGTGTDIDETQGPMDAAAQLTEREREVADPQASARVFSQEQEQQPQPQPQQRETDD